MKNLNKFTKAELISKFKKLENKNSNSNNSNTTLFSKIFDYILYFKTLIFKITLISVLIKTFKKYSVFSKIFRFANWIILSIFGISLIDNFNLDFFKEIKYVLAGIVTYLSNTHFYSFMASLFNTKEVATNQISLRDRPLTEGFSDETTRGQNKSKGSSKISEWLNPEPEIEESNNKKYYVIAGLLILACLSWYYYDEIRTVTPAITNYFRRPRPGNDGTGEPNTGLNNRNIQSGLDNKPTIAERLKSLVNKTDSDQSEIQLQDNIASTSKLKATPPDNSMDHYFSKPVETQMTGLKEITGQNLTADTNAVVGEIDQFLKYYDNASFPKDAVVGAGIYKMLKARLEKLMDVNTIFYGEISDDDKVMEKLDRFTELESHFVTQPGTPISESNNQTNNLDTNNQNILDNQRDTYEEVAVANIESRMAWSDRATPSVHSQDINSQIASPSVHSQEVDPSSQAEVVEQVAKPKYTFGDLLNSIKSRRDDSHVVGSPSNKIASLVNNTDLDDTNLLAAVEETFKEDVALKLDTGNSPVRSGSVDLPKIDIDSSNSSMEQYFPKPDVSQEEVKSGFTNLFSQISESRKNSTSPQISQLGLQPGSPKLSPLNTKPSISNLLDDTTALFDDDDDDILPTSQIDKGKAKEVDENLLSNVINDWEKVETNIHFGESPTDITVDLKYDNLWTRISSYRFIMNTGQVIDYPFATNGNIRERSFDLSSRIEKTVKFIEPLKKAWKYN